MITSRDLEVVDFLNEYKVASTSTIQELFFPSLLTCQKRLKILSDEKRIKRIRDNINNQYIYFTKNHKQLRHSLLVTDFYRELHKRTSEVLAFKIEPVLGDIRPDAVMGYKINGKGYLGLLEIEISNKGFKADKYNDFFDGGFKKYFPSCPYIFVVTKQEIPARFIKISINFSDFRLPK